MREIPVPKHVPAREEDFWPDTLWRSEDHVWNNPDIIAARWLQKKGFGISLERPSDPSDKTHIAVHVATFHDRRALDVLADSEEVRTLRRSIYAGQHTKDPISWYLDAERVIEQAIERNKLKPKLINRFKRVLGKK